VYSAEVLFEGLRFPPFIGFPSPAAIASGATNSARISALAAIHPRFIDYLTFEIAV
jgi:hypothetical protein